MNAKIVAKPDDKDTMTFLRHAEVGDVVQTPLYIVSTLRSLTPRRPINRVSRGMILREPRFVFAPPFIRSLRDVRKG